MKIKSRLLFNGSKMWVGAGALQSKSIEGVSRVLQNEDIEGIVFGSITMNEKTGNPGNTFQVDEHKTFSINSIGLTNYGFTKYETLLPEIVALVHEKNKKIIISVAGDSPEEFAELTALAIRAGADGIELNLGCPNKWKAGVQQEIISFDTSAIHAVLVAVYDALLPTSFPLFIGVKLSPYSNPVDIVRVSKVINEYDYLNYVVTSNTFPNGYDENDEGESLITKHQGNPSGYGGIAGASVFAINYGQVKQFRALLREDISIVGVGGICGPDAGNRMKKYLQAADAVQIVTAYYEKEDPGIFSDIYSKSL